MSSTQRQQNRNPVTPANDKPGVVTAATQPAASHNDPKPIVGPATHHAPTIEIDARDAPNAGPAVDADEVARLQAELEAHRQALAAAQAELAAARSRPAAPVEVELETGAPKWVRQVSGMERSEIKGWVDLPGNLLIVTDKRNGQHRFTYLSSQKSD